MGADAEDAQEAIRRLYRNVELAVRPATLLVGADGLVVGAHKVGAFLGCDDADLVGGPPVPPGWQLLDDAGRVLDPGDHPALAALRTQRTVDGLLGFLGPDDVAPRSLRLVAHPVLDDTEVAVDVVIEDGDRRERDRARLLTQERRFRTLTDLLPVAVWEAAESGEITYVNPAFTLLTGLDDPSEVPDLPMLEIVHPDDLLTVLEAAARAPEEGEYRSRYRVVHRDGSSRWVVSRMSLLVDDDGHVAGFVGAIEDVDDLQQAEEESRRLQAIVDAGSDAVVVFEDGALRYLNAAARTLVARTAAPAADPSRRSCRPEPSADRIDPDATGDLGGTSTEEALLDRLGPLVPADDAEGRRVVEIQLPAVGRGVVDLSVSVTTTRGADGRSRTLLVARDIQEQKAREARLAHHATHDPLTGLPNRSLLDARIAQVARSGAGPVVAFYADIDRFKAINDEHGHDVGDQVIVAVAERLAAAVRSEDLVARIGGDELVGWCTSATDRASVPALAERLVDAVGRAPVAIGSLVLDVSVSVGLAVADDGDVDDLVVRADRALYEAKRAGRNCWHLHDDGGPEPRPGAVVAGTDTTSIP